MTILIRTIALLLFLFTCHTPARAEVLVVGISLGYPPYYYEIDGTFTGFCIDTVNAVAQKMALQVEYKVFPWKRLILSAQKGTVDAIMPLFKTEERKKYLIFNGLALAPESNHFFVAAKSPILFTNNLTDLKPYRIGVVEDYSYGARFDSFDFPKKEITRDDKHLIEMFMHNRFEIGVGNRYVVQYYAELAGIAESIKFLEPYITKQQLYLGFVKKQNGNKKAEKFAKTLQTFKTTTAYRELIAKYGIVQ